MDLHWLILEEAGPSTKHRGKQNPGLREENDKNLKYHHFKTTVRSKLDCTTNFGPLGR